MNVLGYLILRHGELLMFSSDIDFLVDMSTYSAMTKKTLKSTERHRPRKIVGFSLPPELAAEVKIEAARKNTTLRNLFTEMWGLYKNKNST